MNKKKLVALFLCVAMLAIVAVTGTLAYFTDADAETNVFTVGSVKIDLLESRYHRELDAADGATALSDEAIIAYAATYQSYLAEAGKDIVPGRMIRKAPYVQNVGKNDAYVRVRMLVPNNAMMNALVVEATEEAQTAGDITVAKAIVDYKGVECVQVTYTYENALAPQEMTYWPAFWQVSMPTGMTSADAEAYAAAGFIKNGAFEIIVEADAIQAETFANAAEAFAAFVAP